MKKLLTLMMVLAVACSMPQRSQQEAQAASVQQMRFHCDQDTLRINRLLQDGMATQLKSANELVAYYADRLLGTPYVAHTLEGDQERLTINIDELDCTTFIETLYALTRTTLNGRYSWRDYQRLDCQQPGARQPQGGDLRPASCRLYGQDHRLHDTAQAELPQPEG